MFCQLYIYIWWLENIFIILHFLGLRNPGVLQGGSLPESSAAMSPQGFQALAFVGSQVRRNGL